MWSFFNKIFTNDRKQFRPLHIYILIAIILIVSAIYLSRYFGSEQSVFWLWSLTIFEYQTTFFGILFFIPLIYAAVFLNIKALMLTWLVCGLLMFPRVTALSFHMETILRAYIVYTLPFIVSMLVKTEMMWREMERRSAAEKEEQRRKYLSQLYKAHETERKNIARELHDSVIQSLIVLTNQAQGVITNKNFVGSDQKPEKDPNIKVEQVVALRDMSREISRDIRNICLNLRPYIIDDMGFIPAIRWLINRTKTNVSISLTVDGIERRFDPETELMVYRILQEAINNINRHSMATEASIRLCFYDNGLKIVIEDNGKGFVFPEKASALTEEGKLGLIGMQERVKLLKGDIKIVSQLGHGTLITIDAAI